MTRAEFTRKWLGNQSKGYNSYHRDEMFEDLDSVIEGSVKNCNLPVVNGSISDGDAIMAILDWMKSDDCWIEDKDGNKLTDVEICGRFNPKYLEKYYR